MDLEKKMLDRFLSRLIYPMVVVTILATVWVVAWNQSLQQQLQTRSHRAVVIGQSVELNPSSDQPQGQVTSN
jgi:hypothetical protein